MFERLWTWETAGQTALAAVLALWAPLAQAEALTVFAAASLGDLLEDIADDWTAETGQGVVISPAGSSLIARQVAQGAPADLVILANHDWMDWLQARGAIDSDSRFDWLGNRLVVVAPADASLSDLDMGDPQAWQDALGPGRLAMALTTAVPAGIYGRAALTDLGVWPVLAPRLAEADNVRAALAWVAAGAAPLGVVYATDAQAEPRVAVVATLPADSHPPIRYPAALRPDAGQAARDFLTYLQGPDARAHAAAHGFAPAGG
ncbi:MAG: molybdate ABC transporter substrate-binding protein [Marinibacterium sp.]|nr:molybdate ABC transporter substrate-binding protein [Marinibacterium sp.]